MTPEVEIPFQPARVILQDFTGVPAVVDLAAMRNAITSLGGNPEQINPLCPVDLVIDHSIQVDVARTATAYLDNERIEIERNRERFEFLKWGQSAFQNLKIVPPGSGIVHQVNMEYLARVVFDNNGLLYPDSVVGTDSHTTMINGLGVVGWGVGGIEAEAVMLGQPISMVLPEVIGVKLTGELPKTATATDLVLTLTQLLRKKKVVEKFVEFYGPGVKTLSLPDRATVSNMAPEYGATLSYFPIDEQSVEYLKLTGRDAHKIAVIEHYLRAQGLFRDYTSEAQDPHFTGEVLHLDLATVHPCLAGPKLPQDKVALADMAKDFSACLTAPVGDRGFGLKPEELPATGTLTHEGKEYALKHGSVVIAAITSCTNTSNPSVLIAAGLVARNAVAKGLNTLPFVKTSLSPGSGVVTKYLADSGLDKPLAQIGFTVAGFGCMTCIGNSGELSDEVSKAIKDGNLVAGAVLSGNRNFEGRVHPLTKANYLASPPLVVAYALAGRLDIDFETEPIGHDPQGNSVFLRDIWPAREEIDQLVKKSVTSEMFRSNYATITEGSEMWKALQAETGKTYSWKESTYINHPPFFQGITKEQKPVSDIANAYCLLNLGNNITTDHISPAGNIATVSTAAKWLNSKGVEKKDFNTYGARRGNDLVMSRGTFANIRIKNKLVNNVEGPHTVYVPTNEKQFISDAAEKYIAEGHQLVILAGENYGTGSSRDWAAKGPFLLGVKAVIAQSYERIHRSNLVGMGILPLQFLAGQGADSLGLTGFEKFCINLNGGDLKVAQHVTVTTDSGKSFEVLCRLDTPPELLYFRNGGILQTVLRNLSK